MSGFLRSIARMAIGIGPRLEPLVDSIYAGNFELGVQEEESSAAQAIRAVEVQPTIVHNHLNSTTNIDSDVSEHLSLITQSASVDNRQAHAHHQTTIEEGDQTFITNQRAKESHTIRETVRELLRESEKLRSEKVIDRVERLESHTKVESTNLTAFLETERIVRETRTQNTRIQREKAVVQAPHETAQEPVIEITIGRIEVKSTPKEGTKDKTKEAKPTGVIALNDYLRERTKGAI